jgi:hypothetical protein
MLTDKQCKNASCPEGKARIRASDSGGLYIEVAGAGSKRWFWKYYFDGKEKRLSLGSYPEVSRRMPGLRGTMRASNTSQARTRYSHARWTV